MQRKIVVIDDDYGIQDVTRLIFEKAGFDTVILATPASLYENEHKDASIILLDRQLAGYDGLEVCKYLKHQSEFKKTPVLLMSATNTLPDNFSDFLVDGFIEKPFNKKNLLEKIENLLATLP